jgi:tetratricopeptide (TPR) repeat protein
MRSLFRVVGLLLLLSALAVASAPAQQPPPLPAERRAEAYYHFMLAKFYDKQYEDSGRSEDATLAIEHYKKAYALDPQATVIGERLAEMYYKAQRARDAVLELQEIIQREPENLSARRLLARIYRRTLSGRTNLSGVGELANRAIEQYAEIFRRDPADLESASTLARLYRMRQEPARAEEVLRQALEHLPGNEELLQQLAQLLVEQGRSRQAIELLEAPARAAASPELLARLGGALLEAGEAARAEEVLRRAAELDPDDTDHRRRLAQALAAQDKWAEAAAEYEALLKLDPGDVQSYLQLAMAHRRMKRFDLAAADLAQARRISPSNAEVLYHEALLYEEQGRFDEAIQTLSSAITALRADARRSNRRGLAVLHEQLARLYRATRNFSAAINTYRELLKSDPETEKRARQLIADTFRESRDIARALEESRAALELFPADRSTRITHALLLADSGQAEAGAALLREMLRGDTSDRDLYITLAQLYERGRLFARAEEAIRKAERLGRSPAENEVVWFLLGAIFERQKKFAEAEEQFRKVLEVNPRNAQALNYYGYMLADRGVRLEEAVALVQRALEEEPHNGSYLDSLGWAYFKQNKLADAEEYLLRAVERAGQQPVIREHLGDLYSATGRLEQAAAEWQRALEEWQRALPADRDPELIAAVEKKLEDAKKRLARKGVPDPKPR